VRWRNILWIGPTAAFGLIIALYTLLSTYDYNSLKPRIERAVRDATGRAAETIAKAVGGIVLFGPAGVALEAAEKGVPLSVVEKQEKKPGVLGQAGEALGEGLDKVGKKLKELFGR
jgi:hypothetical protein